MFDCEILRLFKRSLINVHISCYVFSHNIFNSQIKSKIIKKNPSSANFIFATYYDGTGCGNIFYVCYISMVIPIYSLTCFDAGKNLINLGFILIISWVIGNNIINRETKLKMLK